MKAKKVLKNIAKVFLIILGALMLLWLIIFINSRIRLRRDKAFLKKKGYCSLVSVGDYSVNVLSFGNENGKHKIIAMAGYGIPDSCITMRRMTAALEADDQVIFVDRAGYGISDDTKEDMTVEKIVEAYRTSLRNSGVEAPYVLMAHSIGGLYATYWESKYPDEIEAVVIIDGTELEAIPPEDQRKTAEGEILLYYRLVKAGLGGLGNIVLKRYLPPKEWLSADEQRMEYALTLMTYDSRSLISENKLEERNINTAWEAIVTNDIPKIYITTDYLSAEDIEADCVLTDEMIDDLIKERREAAEFYEKQYKSGAISEEEYKELLPKMPESKAERRQIALEQLLDLGNDHQKSYVIPYVDKLGNCEIIDLPGDHLIYEQKPDECGRIIKDFIDEI